MKKKGFTLVELLAVIVILAVIGIITIPLIGNVIKDSKKKALETSVYGLVEAANYFTISNDGVYGFLFSETSKGKTEDGEYSLDYNGEIDAKGELYIDNNGDISLCLENEDYYVYKNYNSGIYIGEMTEHGCVVGYDVLTNKYVAMLDDGTGQVSNVYSKEEVNNLIDSVNTNVTNNTNEITSIKENITSLQTDISNYALKSDLEILNSKLNANVNMRYNSENDMVEIFYNNSWNEWKKGNQQSYYLIHNYVADSDTIGNLEASAVGLASYSKVKPSYNVANYTYSVPASTEGTLFSTNLINLDGYSTLHIKYTAKFADSATQIRIGFTASKSFNNSYNPAYTIHLGSGSNETTYDISSLTNKLYLYIWLYYGADLIIEDIWLT